MDLCMHITLARNIARQALRVVHMLLEDCLYLTTMDTVQEKDLASPPDALQTLDMRRYCGFLSCNWCTKAPSSMRTG